MISSGDVVTASTKVYIIGLGSTERFCFDLLKLAKIGYCPDRNSSAWLVWV